MNKNKISAYSLIMAASRGGGGGGSAPVIQSKTITENGTYTVPAGVDGFNPVVVDVPEPSLVGFSITENGTYIAEDEGYDGFNRVIVNVSGGGDFEPIVWSGDIGYVDNNGVWDNVISKYSGDISTQAIIIADNAFYKSNLEEIPITFNISGSTGSFTNMFSRCKNLRHIPKLSGTINGSAQMFNGCKSLTSVTAEDFNDVTFTQNGSRAQMFAGCSSLLHIDPELLLKLRNSTSSFSTSVYYYLFQGCFVLPEIVSMPVISRTLTSRYMYETVTYCSRLSRFVFETNDNTPITVMWKSQILDLTTVGALGSIMPDNILDNSSIHGITNADKVTDAASYEALKNTDKWWTADVKYSRYNHTSAVETINSLPDASAYLATAGGTNTIKFKGSAGSLTDGGAINTLTEAEIAVAAAKGWTVTFE